MSARKVGQYVVDWVKVGSKIPQAARSELSGFRSRHEAIKTRLETLSSQPETLDWNFYKQHISKPGFVELFEKSYNAVKVPYPEDTRSKSISGEEKDYEAKCVEVLKETDANIASLREELAQIKALKPYEEITSDEYLADKPELRKQLDAEFKSFIYK